MSHSDIGRGICSPCHMDGGPQGRKQEANVSMGLTCMSGMRMQRYDAATELCDGRELAAFSLTVNLGSRELWQREVEAHAVHEPR